MLLNVQETTLGSMRLVVSERADDWRLQVHVSASERVLLTGEDARRFASVALPRVNQAGGTAKVVREAVSEIERIGGPERFLLGITARVTPQSGILTGAILSKDDPRVLSVRVKPLSALPAPVRLAAEMSLHEAQERSALDGELALLEAAWRDAEEIASIADSMLLPPNIESQLEALRRTRSRSD
jgi:hypothetical protein